MTEYLHLLNRTELTLVLRVLALLGVGIPFVYALDLRISTFVSRRLSPQQGMIIGRSIRYGGLALIFATVFKELGFSLSPLLGAAGIVGIAVGFASQTSVSNIISGIFLITEKPFVVGDSISIVGLGVSGSVISIDMLSVKLRTMDNKYVRIPNETIIKSPVVNESRYPIRRIDLKFSIAQSSNIAEARKILLDTATLHPACLQDPPPQVTISGFGASSIDLLFVSWAAKEDVGLLTSALQEEAKIRLDAAGIEMPYNHVTVVAPRDAAPFPLAVTQRPSI